MISSDKFCNFVHSCLSTFLILLIIELTLVSYTIVIFFIYIVYVCLLLRLYHLLSVISLSFKFNYILFYMFKCISIVLYIYI